jgi:hypothetical protein
MPGSRTPAVPEVEFISMVLKARLAEDAELADVVAAMARLVAPAVEAWVANSEEIAGDSASVRAAMHALSEELAPTLQLLQRRAESDDLVPGARLGLGLHFIRLAREVPPDVAEKADAALMASPISLRNLFGSASEGDPAALVAVGLLRLLGPAVAGLTPLAARGKKAHGASKKGGEARGHIYVDAEEWMRERGWEAIADMTGKDLVKAFKADYPTERCGKVEKWPDEKFMRTTRNALRERPPR